MTNKQHFEALKLKAEAEMEAEVMSTKFCDCKAPGLAVVTKTTDRPFFRHGHAVCTRCNGMIVRAVSWPNGR